jgi:Methyltransferase FkbM domain
MTLEDILNKYNAPNGKTVLKMDCEGAEYEIILSATVDTLLRFSHLLIEYHYGYNKKLATGKDDQYESNKPDYDDGKDQLEEEQVEEIGEITNAITTNKAFYR